MSGLKREYNICWQYAKSHYENFPVASYLLPKKIRDHVAAIYCFARIADDIADEGNLTPQERIEQLETLEHKIKNIDSIQFENPIFAALQHSIKTHNLPQELFLDLLQAFKQDVTKKRYKNNHELLEYCCNSANPIGRLLLILNKQHTENNLLLSDNICTALQLINFLQDIQGDYNMRDRFYFATDNLEKFNLKLPDINNRHPSTHWQPFLLDILLNIKKHLKDGEKLGQNLHGRFGIEIRTIILCAKTVCTKLEQNISQQQFFKRPILSKYNLFTNFCKAIIL